MKIAVRLLRSLSIAVVVFLSLGCVKLCAQPECSLVKTNHNCTYTVDRSLPLTPTIIQMFSGETVRVAINNAYSFETYSLDWSAGSLTAKPDVATNVFTALQPSLKNLEVVNHNYMAYIDKGTKVKKAAVLVTCDPTAINAAIKAKAINATYASQVIDACFDRLQTLQAHANQFYGQVQAAIWPDSIMIAPTPAAAAIGLTPNGTTSDLPWEEAMVCELFAAEPADGFGNRPLSRSVSKTLSSVKPPIDCSKLKQSPMFFGLYNQLAEVSSVIGALNSYVNPSTGGPLFPDQDVLDNLQLLVDTKAVIDSTRTDISGYGTRLVGLIATPPFQTPPGRATSAGAFPIVNATKTQIPSVTYNVNALNLVLNPSTTTDSTKKKLVVAITVVYGDARWEVSAGTFFSSIPVRSFAASPVFMPGNPDAITDKKVTESDVRPLVIPFGAVNYRLTHDLKRPMWRENWYWSFAVGINPNTVTSDFATGPSWSYRGLMLSGFWHIGHDVRLIPNSGVKVGDSLGASFSGSLPTQNYWRFGAAGIAISIRTAALTGR